MSDDVNVCMRCSDNFIVNSKCLQCKICQKRFHSSCLSLRDDIYKFLFKSENIFWFCDECKKVAMKKTMANSNSCADQAKLIVYEKEIDCLQREKELLNKLVSEMKSSSDLMQYKINELETKFNSSFSNTTQSFLPHSQQKSTHSSSYSCILQKRVNNNDSPALLIKSNDNKQSDDVIKMIKSAINPASLNICINGTKNIKNGTTIFCKDSDSLSKLQNIVKTKFGKKFDVRSAIKNNPRLLIKNIHPDINSDNDLIESIISLNELNECTLSDFKVITTLKLKSLQKHVVVEVTPKIRKKLLEKGFLWIGWKKCAVVDHLNVVQCFKCQKFGHYEKDCKNIQLCVKCSGTHSLKACDKEDRACVNCVNYNNKYKTNVPVDHTANDKSCQVYQMYVDKLQSNINYE